MSNTNNEQPSTGLLAVQYYIKLFIVFCVVCWMFRDMWNSVLPWLTRSAVQPITFSGAANILGVVWAAGRVWGMGTAAAMSDELNTTIKMMLASGMNNSSPKDDEERL